MCSEQGVRARGEMDRDMDRRALSALRGFYARASLLVRARTFCLCDGVRLGRSVGGAGRALHPPGQMGPECDAY